MKFTPEELEAIMISLEQAIHDGFAEDDNDPIVTAFQKIKEHFESKS